MTKSKKKNKRIKEIIILVLIAVVSLFFWDTFILFPVKLIVVFLHESSHALAAILTGGNIIKMDIGLNLGGRSEISGGNTFIIASAGYLGSFLFGSAFFYSTYSKEYDRWIIITIMTVIILFAVNVITNVTIQLLAVLFAALVLLSLWFLPAKFNKYIFKSLGLISCIYVVYDIKEDILTSASSSSDASIIARLTGIPGLFWGLLWIAISVTGLFLLFRFGYINAK